MDPPRLILVLSVVFCLYALTVSASSTAAMATTSTTRRRTSKMDVTFYASVLKNMKELNSPKKKEALTVHFSQDDHVVVQDALARSWVGLMGLMARRYAQCPGDPAKERKQRYALNPWSNFKVGKITRDLVTGRMDIIEDLFARRDSHLDTSMLNRFTGLRVDAQNSVRERCVEIMNSRKLLWPIDDKLNSLVTSLDGHPTMNAKDYEALCSAVRPAVAELPNKDFGVLSEKDLFKALKKKRKKHVDDYEADVTKIAEGETADYHLLAVGVDDALKAIAAGAIATPLAEKEKLEAKFESLIRIWQTLVLKMFPEPEPKSKSEPKSKKKPSSADVGETPSFFDLLKSKFARSASTDDSSLEDDIPPPRVLDLDVMAGVVAGLKETSLGWFANRFHPRVTTEISFEPRDFASDANVRHVTELHEALDVHKQTMQQLLKSAKESSDVTMAEQYHILENLLTKTSVEGVTFMHIWTGVVHDYTSLFETIMKAQTFLKVCGDVNKCVLEKDCVDLSGTSRSRRRESTTVSDLQELDLDDPEYD